MEHPGIVTAVKPGFVTVQIESTSACAACQAHGRCGFAESKTKTLDIPIKGCSAELAVGSRVVVMIDEGRGLLATWWAYVVPAILLLATVIGSSLAGLSEPIVVLLSLAILGVYILLLFLLRKKLDSKFTLKVIGLLHEVAGRDQGQADGLVVSERLNGVNGFNGFNGVVDGLC